MKRRSNICADCDRLYWIRQYPVLMDRIRVYCDKTKDGVIKVTSLKNQAFELDAKLRQSSKHAAAAKVCKNAVGNELSTVRGELAESCEKCANLRWSRNETVSQTEQTVVNVSETLKAKLTSSAALCA